MRVPFLDLKAPYAELRRDIDAAVQRVLASGWYIRGGELRAFETQFAREVGAAHCLGVSNGLDALYLVLRAWGVGPGDEVIVPSHTFIATWLAVTYTGATPVPAEIDPVTFTIDPDAVRRAITPRTRAVIPVHLYGLPADMEPIVDVAHAHGVRVLEDAAQAHGARYRGRPAGSLADAAAFSFYPGKNLGALGDAGAVTTNDEALAARVRELANYGSARKYEHRTKGVNARLDEMQAAILSAKLPHLAEWNRRRAAVAARYTAGLAGAAVVRPHTPAWCHPSWHLYVVRSRTRDALRDHLARAGVETLIHYPTPPHLQPAYAELGLAAGAYPIAEAAANEVLSLPIGPHLDLADADYVIQQIMDA